MGDKDRVCRICLHDDAEEQLLQDKCDCKGSHGCIHESCLKSWVAVLNESDDHIPATCTTCQRHFPLQHLPLTIPSSKIACLLAVKRVCFRTYNVSVFERVVSTLAEDYRAALSGLRPFRIKENTQSSVQVSSSQTCLLGCHINSGRCAPTGMRWLCCAKSVYYGASA